MIFFRAVLQPGLTRAVVDRTNSWASFSDDIIFDIIVIDSQLSFYCKSYYLRIEKE